MLKYHNGYFNDIMYVRLNFYYVIFMFTPRHPFATCICRFLISCQFRKFEFVVKIII